MSFLRSHSVVRFVWFLMALHILNCSIDTIDPGKKDNQESLAFNDIESIVELILEEVLHIKNAIPEHSEDETNQGQGLVLKKGIDFIFFFSTKVFAANPAEDTVRYSNFYFDHFFSSFKQEIDSPPPKNA